MKLVAIIPLVAAAFPVAVAGEDAPAPFSDNSVLVSCYLEASDFVDGKPQKPAGEQALLYVVQFERDKPFSKDTSRDHDPNGLLDGTRLEQISTMDSPQGKVLLLEGFGNEGVRSTLSLVLEIEDQRGNLASLSRQSFEGGQPTSKLEEFYTGRCKLWQLQTGANLLFEGFLDSEPVLKLGRK